MTKIEMYTTSICPWCVRAKKLLNSVGEYDIEEIDVSSDRSEMIERAGGRYTVPQIFINGDHIGGYDDLSSWYRDGRLKRALDH